MRETFTTTSIILNRRDHGENDLRVDILSRDKGRMTLTARGAKKMTSKLAAHLEPFTISDVMVVAGKGSDYAGAAAGKMFFSSLKRDLRKLKYAGMSVGVILKEVREEGGEPEVYFELLRNMLEALEETEEGEERYRLLYGLYLFKFSQIYGNIPEVYTCPLCGEEITGDTNYFHIDKGRVVCGKCSPRPEAKDPVLTISRDCLKFIRLATELEFKEATKFGTSKSVLVREIYSLAERFHFYNFT